MLQSVVNHWLYDTFWSQIILLRIHPYYFVYIRGGWNIHFWSNFLGGAGIFALGHVWTGEKKHFTIRLYLDPPQIRWKFGPNIKFYKGKSAENGQKWRICGIGHSLDRHINCPHNWPFLYSNLSTIMAIIAKFDIMAIKIQYPNGL
jgi:hypothetical protein